MPDTYHVRYTARSAEDLEAISRYIARHSPDNAAHMVHKIVDAIDSLDILPHRYTEIGPGIRSMPVPPYLVRYTIDERRRAVMILHVRHGARQHP
ncbi:MAG TPA: type II toxin-antitoxin system RelE/ParE family toxin [Tepidisphaeraceae bacterium]|jgi:plasmid stabilization system protein ParE